MRGIDGLSYEEMAETANVSGTILSRLFHARQKLQKALADVYQEQIGALPDPRTRSTGEASGRGAEGRETGPIPKERRREPRATREIMAFADGSSARPSAPSQKPCSRPTRRRGARWRTCVCSATPCARRTTPPSLRRISSTASSRGSRAKPRRRRRRARWCRSPRRPRADPGGRSSSLRSRSPPPWRSWWARAAKPIGRPAPAPPSRRRRSRASRWRPWVSLALRLVFYLPSAASSAASQRGRVGRRRRRGDQAPNPGRGLARAGPAGEPR